jgi:hypothetical protein
LPDRRKTEEKTIDRPRRNVRPFIWPSSFGSFLAGPVHDFRLPKRAISSEMAQLEIVESVS